ncbi:MAG: sugar ABC transporter permease [Ruminococcaceae bacterium]|nr:sugar ABC transporter permease [Oscillospiraceae bacterium]
MKLLPTRQKQPRRARRSGVKREGRLKFISGAFILPSAAGMALFYVIPFALVFYYAMVDNPIGGNFVFLDNFRMLFNNLAFKMAATNTASFSLISVPLAVILSLLLAILLDSKIPLRSQFRTFFLSPMMVPVASVVLIWQVIFHYNGALNALLANFGVDPIDWLKSDYNQLVVILLFLWKNLGYNMILYLAAISNVPVEILEVATIEGCSAVGKFFHIKLRYLSSTILFVTILSLINSFKLFREVYLLTGDHPYEGLYLLQHFINNTFASLDYQKLSAAAIIMSAVMIVIIGILFLAENRFGKDVEG